MITITRDRSHARGLPTSEVKYVYHTSFAEPGAEDLYGYWGQRELELAPEASHMPDEVTRETARRMHYAAYRLHQAGRSRSASRWRQAYYTLRDQIVVGNRKLIYPAVHRWTALANQADDLIGECHIVLLHAVAAYNPWLGIRFSTYAFTCLMRALSRLAQRSAADKLTRSLTLETVADHNWREESTVDTFSPEMSRLDEFLRQDHPLLSEREKVVLRRRFNLTQEMETPTLEEIGHDLGISKERVRQVQATALVKLRRALLGIVPHC
jgi:RNA polymerase sigma factor (sigma-70 family)